MQRTLNPRASRLLIGLLSTGTLLATQGRAAAHDGPDAQISHTHNEVRSQPAPSTQWHDAELGEALYKKGRVNTGDEATAAILLRDDSTIALRAKTLLIVYGHHALRNKKIIAMDAELERGTLRARLGELEGERKAGVKMPGGEAKLAGGNNLIKVDDEGTGRVANHGDGQTSVVGNKGGNRKLKKGMGVKVKKNKPVEKPILLPPTPSWTPGTTVFLTAPGRRSTIRGTWGTIPKAETYFVEVASDPVGLDVLSAVEVPKQVDNFEVHGLPVGRYHVTVAAVDDDQFESIPSEVYSVRLVEVGFEGAGGTQPLWSEDNLTPVPTVLPGTVVTLPEGVRCASSADAPLESSVTLMNPGTADLRCETDAGETVEGFPIEVVDLGVGMAVPDDAKADALMVTRGRQVTREIQIDADIPLPDQIFLDTPEGVRVDSIESLGEGRWSVTLFAEEGSPANADIGVSFVGEDGGAAPGTTFTTVSLTVSDPEEAAPEPLEPERHMFELGIGGGLFLASDRHALFRPAVADQQPLRRPSPEVLIRAGYYPIRWVGVEIAGRYAAARTVDGGFAPLWSARVQLVGQLPSRVTPYINAGIEAIGISSSDDVLGRDTDYALVVGGGLKAYVTRRVALRLGAGAVIADGPLRSLVPNFEVDLGVAVVLGRRSADRL